MERYIPCKWETKKAGVAILILDKKDLKIKIMRDKEGRYIMIKGSVQEEDITNINLYRGAPQYIRKTLTDIKMKNIARDKEGYYIMIKGSIQEEYVTIAISMHPT